MLTRSCSKSTSHRMMSTQPVTSSSEDRNFEANAALQQLQDMQHQHPSSFYLSFFSAKLPDWLMIPDECCLIASVCLSRLAFMIDLPSFQFKYKRHQKSIN